jgi:hypothetical protein
MDDETKRKFKRVINESKWLINDMWINIKIISFIIIILIFLDILNFILNDFKAGSNQFPEKSKFIGNFKLRIFLFLGTLLLTFIIQLFLHLKRSSDSVRVYFITLYILIFTNCIYLLFYLISCLFTTYNIINIIFVIIYIILILVLILIYLYIKHYSILRKQWIILYTTNCCNKIRDVNHVKHL